MKHINSDDFKQELLRKITETLEDERKALLSYDIRKLFVKLIDQYNAYDLIHTNSLYVPSGNVYLRESGLVILPISPFINDALEAKEPHDSNIKKIIKLVNHDGTEMQRNILVNSNVYATTEKNIKTYIDERISKEAISFRGSFELANEVRVIDSVIMKIIRDNKYTDEGVNFIKQVAIYEFRLNE